MPTDLRALARAAIQGNPVDPLKKPSPSGVVDVFGAAQDDIAALDTRVTSVEALPDQLSGLEDQMVAADTAAAGRLTVLEGQVLLQRHPLASARFAVTTVNANLASTTAWQAGAVHDGLTLVAGDRFPVFQQISTPSQNGVYVVQATGAPVRATDADAGSELLGATIKVLQGTYAGTTFAVTNTTAPTVGTDGIGIVATDKQSTANDDDLRRTFPSSMETGRQFFSGASGDPKTRGALPAAFVFSDGGADGFICTVTLTANQAFNMSFAGLFTATPGRAVDIVIDYQILSGSMANIGPQLFKIGASPTYSSAGAAVDTSTADTTTGVRKKRSARFSDSGSSSPTTTVYPNNVAWQSAAAMLRPSINLKAGAGGAVVVIYAIYVLDASPAAQTQRIANQAKRAALPAYGQMDYSPLSYFSNLASGDPDTIADATNTLFTNDSDIDGSDGIALVGPGDFQITQKAAHDATPGRIYVVEYDFVMSGAGSALIDIVCYRLGRTFVSLGAAVAATLGTFDASSGRQTGTVMFRDSAGTGIMDWSAGGNPAAKLRFGLRPTYDGGSPGTVHVKTLRAPDAVGGGGGSSEDADRAEAAADRAEAAQGALEGILFIQHNPLFDNSGIGWWVDAYTASPAGGQLAATQNGTTFATDAAAKGGQKAAIILDDALVLWRKLRSVDTTLGYAVTCSVKAASGTLTFSAGLACYDYAGTFLGYRWCAANGATVGTSYTEFTGAITGEGVGDGQFPSGTKRVREAWRINGSTNADLAQLILTYSGA